MKKLVVFAVLVATLLCMTMGVSAKTYFDEVTKPEMGGKYYLCATVDGTDYYYRATKAGESVTDTTPYSLYVTSDTEEKNLKEFTVTKLGDGFYLGYPNGQNIHKIYSADIVVDGKVDTGINSTLDAARHRFYWDGNKNQIFSIKGDVKHILAVKMMKNTKNGNEELHMLSIPEKEFKQGGAYAVRFVSLHEHNFSNKLTANEYSHWFPCSCGEKGEIQMHQVDNWTVTKEATKGEEGSRTGTCTVCGEKAVESIPALKEKANENKEEEEQKDALQLDPVVIAVAAVLVVAGVAILLFGGKSKKKETK